MKLKMSEFLKKKSEKVFLLHVNVKPNSKIQEISSDGESLTISLKSKPIQNRANKELLKIFKSKLKGENLHQLQITSGLKSSNKILELVFLEDKDIEIILQKLL